MADPYTQGIIDTNALLDGYKAGAAITFLYELMDEPEESTAQEQNFGLFNADGTPKPAAIAIANLTHILADNGKGTIPVGSLRYSIVGLPTSAFVNAAGKVGWHIRYRAVEWPERSCSTALRLSRLRHRKSL